MGKSNLHVRAGRKQKSPTSRTKTSERRIASVAEREVAGEVRAEHVARNLKAGIKITDSGRSGFVIRDSFTMPVADYELIGVLKQRCMVLGIAVKKSELLRAGIAALDRLSDSSLKRMVSAVENVKTGRPPGRKKENLASNSRQ